MKKVFVLLFGVFIVSLPAKVATADCYANALLRRIAFDGQNMQTNPIDTPLPVAEAYRLMCVGDGNAQDLFQQALDNVDTQIAQVTIARLRPAAKAYYRGFFQNTRQHILNCQQEYNLRTIRPVASPQFEIQIDPGAQARFRFLSESILPTDPIRVKGTHQSYIANDLELYGKLKLCEGSVRTLDGNLVR